MRFYVYGWYEPDGTCFYVGKGTGNRYRERTRRNQYWINVVSQVEATGREVSVKLLHEGLTNEEALRIEARLIEELAPRTNLTAGGTGVTGYKHDTIALDKMRAHQATQWSDPDYRERLRKAHTGAKFSEAHRKAIGDSHRGKVRPAGTGEKIAASKRGIPRSEETKEKIRRTLLNKRLGLDRLRGQC